MATIDSTIDIHDALLAAETESIFTSEPRDYLIVEGKSDHELISYYFKFHYEQGPPFVILYKNKGTNVNKNQVFSLFNSYKDKIENLQILVDCDEDELFGFKDTSPRVHYYNTWEIENHLFEKDVLYYIFLEKNPKKSPDEIKQIVEEFLKSQIIVYSSKLYLVQQYIHYFYKDCKNSEALKEKLVKVTSENIKGLSRKHGCEMSDVECLKQKVFEQEEISILVEYYNEVIEKYLSIEIENLNKEELYLKYIRGSFLLKNFKDLVFKMLNLKIKYDKNELLYYIPKHSKYFKETIEKICNGRIMAG